MAESQTISRKSFFGIPNFHNCGRLPKKDFQPITIVVFGVWQDCHNFARSKAWWDCAAKIKRLKTRFFPKRKKCKVDKTQYRTPPIIGDDRYKKSQEYLLLNTESPTSIFSEAVLLTPKVPNPSR